MDPAQLRAPWITLCVWAWAPGVRALDVGYLLTYPGTYVCRYRRRVPLGHRATPRAVSRAPSSLSWAPHLRCSTLYTV
ncbi:hypothetical protein F5Y07DRAFT_349152, partial [Xylaria sp. FL0933]